MSDMVQSDYISVCVCVYRIIKINASYSKWNKCMCTVELRDLNVSYSEIYGRPCVSDSTKYQIQKS